MLLVMMWKGEVIHQYSRTGVRREIEGAHETTHGRTRLPTRSKILPLKDCINSLSKAAAGKKTIPASTDHSGYNNHCFLIAPKSLIFILINDSTITKYPSAQIVDLACMDSLVPNVTSSLQHMVGGFGSVSVARILPLSRIPAGGGMGISAPNVRFLCHNLNHTVHTE